MSRRNEPIPDELKFDGWKTSEGYGYHKPIHYWIRYHKDAIPDELKFDGWKTSGYKKPIHCWIMYRQGEPIPNELKFDGWETFGEGDKPIHYWI